MIRVGISGLLGLETALYLLKEHEVELRQRFSGAFLKRLERMEPDADPAQAAACSRTPDSAEKAGCLWHMEPVSEGGLFAALWKACDLAEGPDGAGRFGCRIRLRDIPVRQEIIEILELYHENPYETPSKGAWVVLWEDGWTDPDTGFPEDVTEIGCLTRDGRRILLDGERQRYLTPAERQDRDIMDRKGYYKEQKG